MTHRLPAIRTQPETNLPTLFTGLASYWKMRQGNSVGRNKVTQQLYGDGSVIPYKYLAHLAKITGEIRVLHKWQAGDVLVYDNVVAQHEREPWEGEQSDRVVLASLLMGRVFLACMDLGTGPRSCKLWIKSTFGYGETSCEFVNSEMDVNYLNRVSSLNQGLPIDSPTGRRM